MRLHPTLRSVALLAAVCLQQASGQTTTSEGFESYSLGPLHGQGSPIGWAGSGIGAQSQISVTIDEKNSGTKSVYVYDGDTANRPKARYDYGTSVSGGQFDFSVKEAPSTKTAGRDFWQVNFFKDHTGTLTFGLVLSSATNLYLTNGSTTLASCNPSTLSPAYDPNGWNDFSIVFNNQTQTLLVYLNGGSTPILSSSVANSNYPVGRLELSVGGGAPSDQGVYFDDLALASGPQWEYTSVLRYAPPNLVAPLTINVPASYYDSSSANTPAALKFGDTDDVIFKFPTGPRTSDFISKGGRNIRIIGADMGDQALQLRNVKKTAYVEGVKVDMTRRLSSVNGCKVDVNGTYKADGVDITGVPSNTPVAPDFYFQNCNISGIHGPNRGHAAGVRIDTATCKGLSIAGSQTFVTVEVVTKDSVDPGLAVGDTFILGPTLITNANYTSYGLNNTYEVTAVDVSTSTKKITGITVSKTGNHAADYKPNGPLAVNDVGNDGYIWKSGGTAVHGDCIQVQVPGDPVVIGTLHLYKMTMDSSYQCIYAYHAAPDKDARGLKMSRVNIRQNTVWPQDYASPAFYMGGTGSGAPQSHFPVNFDRVYIKPRPNLSVKGMVYPSSGTQVGSAGGFTITTSFLDAPVNKIVAWGQGNTVGADIIRAATDPFTIGTLTDTTDLNGYPGEAGFTNVDYSDLSASNPYKPGANYVSPGYSAEAVGVLVMDGITLNEGPTVTSATISFAPSAVSATNAAISTVDVHTASGQGFIINLVVTGGDSAKFKFDPAHPRNLVTAEPLSPNTNYTITVRASDNANPNNKLDIPITVHVNP